MSVTSAIELMRREGSRLANPVAVDGLAPMEFTCSFADEGVSTQDVSAIVPNCPQDLREFWMVARNARLFTDTTYGQWGLEILDPHESVRITEQFQRRRTRDVIVGDLIVGRFLGDSDMLLLRSDPDQSDYGSVHVALPIDPRVEWYSVAESFAAFLDTLITSGGAKYWVVS